MSRRRVIWRHYGHFDARRRYASMGYDYFRQRGYRVTLSLLIHAMKEGHGRPPVRSVSRMSRRKASASDISATPATLRRDIAAASDEA